MSIERLPYHGAGRHMASLDCDTPGCPETCTYVSDTNRRPSTDAIRLHAVLTGRWVCKRMSKRTVDLCPECAAKEEMPE